MQPSELAKKYDKIAQWWQTRHENGGYGVSQLNKALNFVPMTGSVLDVGCGAGGRFVRLLEAKGFNLTGIDVSEHMIKLAKASHPRQTFVTEDICNWQSAQKFDFIFAWDSLFHLPLSEQKPVLNKLCNMLAAGGVLSYTFGDDCGEHQDQWLGETFCYSSIGIAGNLALLLQNGLTCKHLELDQWPEKHVFIIAVNNENYRSE